MAKHEEFERHRKMHYNMGNMLAKAKQLLEQDESEEDSKDEDK